jgi:hypothetical protein
MLAHSCHQQIPSLAHTWHLEDSFRGYMVVCKLIGYRIVGDHAGLVATYQPPQPRESMYHVAVNSAAMTVCIMDAWTDLSCIQVLLHQVLILCSR